MELCLFLIAEATDGAAAGVPLLPAADDALAAMRAAAGLTRLVVHRPVAMAADRADPAARPPSPACVLQCYFAELAALEAVLGPMGAAHEWTKHWLAAGTRVVQQAMAVRPIAVPGPGAAPRGCTYLVGYEGEAEDPNAWLSHYLDHHPPLMAQLPGIRAVEIYTRVDYRSALPVPRAYAMQRNKVVFDDAGALEHALASPVRMAMREDFDALPPFAGATPHFPMASESFEITSSK
ncbi:EthD family reductase [Burkholderia territorii]|uniref:EthD family reductase n=1 Tax=Burkholderia territorii TaxID=1503055 RepID=UPI000755CED2|nr:EthD family reductase [Burkholderia territorii]KUZ27262.1 ethyl tert-butyl ether degradation protein EthD [Burkholderia territorii]KUZ57270.1 ethyl tert-butyl ether degradation protein EthD [Burkholderia territorii]